MLSSIKSLYNNIKMQPQLRKPHTTATNPHPPSDPVPNVQSLTGSSPTGPSSQKIYHWNKFQQWHNKKHQTPHNGRTLELPIGTVTICHINEHYPQGWRLLSRKQGEENKEKLMEIMQRWSIVGFDKGALQGEGYGGHIKDDRGEECGEVFLVREKGNEKE